MFAKLELYADTIKSMKASQIYYRIRKMLKMNCSLGCSVSSGVELCQCWILIRLF